MAISVHRDHLFLYRPALVALVILSWLAFGGCERHEPHSSNSNADSNANANANSHSTAMATASLESTANEPDALVVFAAASLTEVIEELSGRYSSQTSSVVTTSFAASSTLAKQIEAGAPADVFISADQRWMDHLAAGGHVRAETRVDLVGNVLVLIAPRGQGFDVVPKAGFPIATAFAGKLAMADPEHVPAGRYGRQALEALGWWDKLQGRVVPTGDVRAALRLVEMGEAGAGIVYATDAALTDKVVVVALFPQETYAPVRYPAAVCQDASAAAELFLEFLGGDEAATVFERAGFLVLHGQTPR